MNILHKSQALSAVDKTRTLSAAAKRHEIQCYLLISTLIIGFLVFTIYPILWAIKLSWYHYTGVVKDMSFVGLDNFIKIFRDDATYWKTWLTTLEFTALKVPIEIPLALLIAVVLKQDLKFKGFFRAVYFLPTLIGVVIISVIFTNMFSYFGLVNAWIEKLGLTPIDWFGSSKLNSLFVLAIGSAWSNFGTNVLYFIAALSNVPEDVYESAKIDGAGVFAVFFKITLPLIVPVFATILLLSLNGTLHVNEYVLTMTNGAPKGETFTVMSYITRNFAPGFANTGANIGYGCALSTITSVIFCIFAYFYTKLKNALENIY